MNNQLVWQDRFNIGVDIIDKEHQKLFRIMNRLFTFSEQKEKSQWVCEEGIKYFKDHAMKHFSEEEVYMASISYSGFETHRRLHDDFRQKTLPALENELKQTEYADDAVNHFLSVCAGWLIGHTLTEDRAITGKALSKWADLLPKEDHHAMSRTITNLLQEMFQLNPHVISESYGGEQFVNGIYYRLAYVAESKKKWEFILVFEEKLILHTLGPIMGEKAAKISVMLMNAARYTAKQFAGRILELMSPDEWYELKQENLLTYEQFQSILEEQSPQCSLLFDTKEGYFAFCALAPQMLKDGLAAPIKAENAMTEVKKYLQQTDEENAQENRKQKVLVVDDSNLMRQSTKKMLAEDYHVTTASSGLSAIRCITLDRPDLILLDYEMPVCDGAQILEMIRSEEDFADIPVMFLTGKVDQKSVERIIPLKPVGYLSKTLKASDIKKNIDNYFARRIH